MNKWKYKIMLLLLLLLCSVAILVVGCSRKELQSDGMADGNTLIRAKISTRAVADANALGSAETVIRRVRVYAFDGNKLDKMVYREYAYGAAGEALVEMEVTQTDTKMLYVIINEPDNDAMRGRLSVINNPAAFQEVEYQMADYFSSVGAIFNSSTDFNTVDFCLPMFGQTQNMVNTIVNSSQSAPLEVPLTVIRSLARIDIYVQKEPSVTQVITIDNQSLIDVQKVRQTGFLSPPVIPSDKINYSAQVAGHNTTVPARTTGHAAAIRAYTLYTPERSCATEAERISFALNSINYGGQRMNFDPVIIGNEVGNKLTTIDRNKVHKIYCTFQPKTITINLFIQNWDDQAVVGDIAGTTLFVSQSKVVMDWFNLGKKFDTSVGYVSDGNVSFVGYVIKNADGTDRSVTTNGSNLPTWLPKEKITNLPNGTTKNGEIGLEYVITSDSRPDVALRIKTGNITKDITVVYDNGFVPNDLLQRNGWTENKLSGLGIHATKIGNISPIKVSAASERKFSMLTDSKITNYPQDYPPQSLELRDIGVGLVNTRLLQTLQGLLYSDAAASCLAIGSEWYIPSAEEIIVIFKGITYYGPSYAMSEKYYWCSSLYPYPGTSAFRIGGTIAYIPYLSASTESTAANTWSVRCVRNV